MVIEKVILAEEMAEKNPQLFSIVREKFPKIETVSHEELKRLSKEAAAVIRTGEATPYANIILQAGVIFS